MTSLRDALDRLSMNIDPGLHEDRRFKREEGAAMAKAMEIAADALRQSDFEVADVKDFDDAWHGFIVSHSNSSLVVGRLQFGVTPGAKELRIWFVPGKEFSSNPEGRPSTVPLEPLIDENVLDALAEQISRIQFKGHPSKY